MAVVGELVEAEVAHHRERVADLGDHVGDRGVEDAVGVDRTRALGVLGCGDAEEHHAAEAGRGRLGGRLAQRVARVLDDARHRARSAPARWRPRARTSAAPAGPGAPRSRRPADAAPACAAAGAAGSPGSRSRSCQLLALRRVAGRRSDGLVTGWPDSSIAARRAAPKSASASTSDLDRRVRREHVDPEAVLLGGLRRGRTDHGDHRRRVRLAGDADQVAHRRGRREHDRVELAGLDRLAHRRGGGAARTVR